MHRRGKGAACRRSLRPTKTRCVPRSSARSILRGEPVHPHDGSVHTKAGRWHRSVGWRPPAVVCKTPARVICGSHTGGCVSQLAPGRQGVAPDQQSLPGRPLCRTKPSGWGVAPATATAARSATDDRVAWPQDVRRSAAARNRPGSSRAPGLSVHAGRRRRWCRVRARQTVDQDCFGGRPRPRLGEARPNPARDRQCALAPGHRVPSFPVGAGRGPGPCGSRWRAR